MNLTYLLDPLCGWCYGAHPALERLVKSGSVALTLAPTGLFAGSSARPMDAAFADYAWQNDKRIARLTGQPFSEIYRERVLGARGALFDSAPATLALVAVALEAPQGELAALAALQRARYVDGLDTGGLQTVAQVIATAGYPAAARRLLAPDEPLLDTYRRRIDGARAEMNRFGVHGVPALVAGEGSGRRDARPLPRSPAKDNVMKTQAFPAIGHRYHADYGQMAFNLAFAADGKTLRWADAGAADFDAAAKTETYSATFVRPGVFWVTWKEADGTTVSHVEDFETGTVHAAITMPDHGFYTLTGRLTRRD